ncbi:MAG: hypothetical protein ABSE89_04440 [Sedimentisphaerales bacterium]
MLTIIPRSAIIVRNISFLTFGIAQLCPPAEPARLGRVAEWQTHEI